MKKTIKTLTVLALATTVAITSCKKPDDNGDDTNPPTNNQNPPTITSSTEIKGYNLLNKICGIWNGPITSTTVMGNFAEAPMDFRPISAAQVSQKNELDKSNSVFMSFFVVWTGTEYQVAFRNGGDFGGMLRTAYMKLDSVSETSNLSYYRFVDFKKGAARTITEVSFWGDSLRIKAFTNKSNTQSTATVHMDYRAGLQNSDASQNAISTFGFPKKEMVKNFATAFDGFTETVFYSVANDPYPASAQPYVGKATLSYTVAPTITLPSNAKVVLMVSTQPLIGGTGPNVANFKTRTRYVVLTNPDNSFEFTYMHPGSYYLYALVDANNDNQIGSGEYISAANTAFTLSASGTVSQSTQINFQIP